MKNVARTRCLIMLILIIIISILSIHEWWCGVVVNLGVFPRKRFNAYNEKYLVVNKKLLINCEHTRGDMLLYTFIFTLLLTTSSPELLSPEFILN